MHTRSWQVAALAAIALPALWLLLAGPDRLLGIEGDHLGMGLLVTAAWTSLLALSKLPRGEGEAAIAPAEWRAWIGTGFMAVAVAYFLGNLEVFAAGPDDRAARATATNLVLLLVAWTVLSQVLASRWKGTVEEDSVTAVSPCMPPGGGSGTAAVAVFALAGTLGFSPTERCSGPTPPS